MPVKKADQELYGKIAGRMQNAGYSLDEAKSIADRAISSRRMPGHTPGPRDKRLGKEAGEPRLHHRKKF